MWELLVGACGAVVLGAVVLPVLSLATPAGASNPPLSQFLLKSGEQTGYSVGGKPATSSTPSGFLEGDQFTASQLRNAKSTLKKDGFVKAVEESSKGPGSSDGFSWVIEFTNAAGATSAAALFLHLAQANQNSTQPFSVSGVSGAKGVTDTGSEGGSANAYWSGGDCAFGSGLYNPDVTSATKAAAPVQAGISSQYKSFGTFCP